MKDSEDRRILSRRLALGELTWKELFVTPLRYFSRSDAPFPYRLLASTVRERHSYGYWTTSEMEAEHPLPESVVALLDDSPVPETLDLSCSCPRLEYVNLWNGVAGDSADLPRLRCVTASSFEVSGEARLPSLETVGAVVFRISGAVNALESLHTVHGGIHARGGEPVFFPVLRHLEGGIDTEVDVDMPVLKRIEGDLSMRGGRVFAEALSSVGSLTLLAGRLVAPVLEEVRNGITADVSSSHYVVTARRVQGNVRIYKDARGPEGILNLIYVEERPNIFVIDGCCGGCLINMPRAGVHYEDVTVGSYEKEKITKRPRIGERDSNKPETRPVCKATPDGSIKKYYDPDRERFCPSYSGKGLR